VRKLCSLVVLLLPLAAGADAKKAPDNRQIVDRVAAIVNDQVILTSEVDLRLLPLKAEAMQIPDVNERDRRLAKLANQVLDEMVSDELIVQAAVTAKITVEQSELEQTVDYIKQTNKFDQKQLEDAMKAQGVTLATLRNDLLRQRAINQLIAPKVVVTDEEVHAKYDETQRRTATVAAVNLSQIFVELPDHATEQQQATAKAKAHKAVERVKAGEDFAKVAGEVTDDPTTKSTGGMLGWLDPTTISAEWEPTVFGMDKGEVRGPVTGTKGLYVFYANDIKRTAMKPFAELKDQLASGLRQKALAKLTQAWIEELRKKAYIDIKLK